MNIAIVGAGRIGTAFAFHLSKAGHDVTLVARGERLTALRAEAGIVALDGTRANVSAADALDEKRQWDVVLVTVLAHQVDAVLPALKASAAKAVFFLFNTFEKIERLRDAVGPERFVFGFPNMQAFLESGKLRSVIDGPGMVTTVSSAAWAKTLKEAGFPTEVEADMNSYLRSHAAFVIPTMVAAQWTWQRASALTWTEASRLTGALQEALAVVRELGHDLKPGFVRPMAWLPSFLLTLMLWAVARTAAVKDLGAFGPTEVRALIDAMSAAAPGRTARLLSIRP